MVIKHYADEIHWTNTLGVTIHSREELREFLMPFFSMDFIIVGDDNFENNDISFLTNDITSVWSKNVRSNQLWADGTDRSDCYVHHLRIFRKIGGTWQITNHLISHANLKNT